MNFKKSVKSIQTAGYNGARTVYDCRYVSTFFCQKTPAETYPGA